MVCESLMVHDGARTALCYICGADQQTGQPEMSVKPLKSWSAGWWRQSVEWHQQQRVWPWSWEIRQGEGRWKWTPTNEKNMGNRLVAWHSIQLLKKGCWCHSTSTLTWVWQVGGAHLSVFSRKFGAPKRSSGEGWPVTSSTAAPSPWSLHSVPPWRNSHIAQFRAEGFFLSKFFWGGYCEDYGLEKIELHFGSNNWLRFRYLEVTFFDAEVSKHFIKLSIQFSGTELLILRMVKCRPKQR